MNAFARSDHVHAHGNQPGGSLHALATTSTAGFMSPSDKDKLDNLSSGGVTTTDAKMTVELTNDQLINGDNTFNKINFDDEQFDPSLSFDTATSTYTVPITGFYLITASASADATGANVTKQLAIFKSLSENSYQTPYNSSYSNLK